MSHVTTLEMKVTDVECLAAAAGELGLEIRQKLTYKWFGTHVGDYPLPPGLTREDLGKCDFAIGIPGSPDAYEVGVRAKTDGSGEYHLLWDFWDGGKGLEKAIGKDGSRLVQEYAVQAQMKELRRMGARVSRSVNAAGEVELVAVRRR